MQINLDDEPTKAGVTAEQAFDLSSQIQDLPSLKLRGFPPPDKSLDNAPDIFPRLTVTPG